MPTFFIGFACALVLALGAALSYNFFSPTMTEQTASNAVHVDQKTFQEKAHAATQARRQD
jgi:hypothetical protein